MRANKPRFLRREWHKKIRLGRGRKNKQVWRGVKGRHNKIRLHHKGYARRPRVGWGMNKMERGKIQGLEAIRIENIKQLLNVSKNQGIIIAHVGARKRKEIIGKANEMKIKILNKYAKDFASSDKKSNSEPAKSFGGNTHATKG